MAVIKKKRSHTKNIKRKKLRYKSDSITNSLPISADKIYSILKYNTASFSRKHYKIKI